MIQIDEMRTIQDSETRAILQKIRSPKKLKKYYLAMEFNKINNPEFEDERLYSLDLLAQNNRAPLYTPQINNISMEMPSSPILYNWNKVPKVTFSYNISIIHIIYCSNHIFKNKI